MIEYLGGTQASKLQTSITLSCGDVKDVCSHAKKAIEKGFTKLKIKPWVCCFLMWRQALAVLILQLLEFDHPYCDVLI